MSKSLILFAKNLRMLFKKENLKNLRNRKTICPAIKHPEGLMISTQSSPNVVYKPMTTPCWKMTLSEVWFCVLLILRLATKQQITYLNRRRASWWTRILWSGFTKEYVSLIGIMKNSIIKILTTAFTTNMHINKKVRITKSQKTLKKKSFINMMSKWTTLSAKT